MSTIHDIIAQVYRLSAVHCQVTRYSQGVLGYITRYSVFVNEISVDKNSQYVFELKLGLEENYYPSPLGDFDRLFEGQIKVLFKRWHWNMIYVLNSIKLAPKM